MADIVSIEEYGSQMRLTYSDGTSKLAYPTAGGLWLFARGEVVVPPSPEPNPGGGKRFAFPFDIRRYWEGGDVGPAAEADYGPRSGRVHQGQDFGYGKARAGATIVAAGAGRVQRRFNSGFGNHIVIDHGDSLFTVYGHMSEFIAADGAQVSLGQGIGKVGNTGNSFGAHLHFETHEGGLNWSNPGTHRNPRDFIAKYGG